MTCSPVLEARQVTKRFGGVQALADVSFAVAGGEIHALCGENGAGKSTLMNILTGLLPAGSYEGQVRVEDHRVQFRDVRDAELAGIGIVHQELALVDSLSVAENILLGRFPRRGCRVDWPATYDAADRILREFQVPIDPETPVSELGVGQQQLVEIALAISKHPRILLLDEPTAALSSTETEILLEHVRRLSATGVACVYISHKLEEVLAVADRITVLRDGATVATLKTAEADIATLIRHMVGREMRDIYPPRGHVTPGAVALDVRGLSASSDVDHHVALRNVSLSIRGGEVVGLGGLMGAGRSELLMHLYGLWGQPTAGEVWVRGRPYFRRSPAKSINRGMMLVTESRKRFGLLPNQSTHHNLSLSSLSAVTRCGRINTSQERLA